MRDESSTNVSVSSLSLIMLLFSHGFDNINVNRLAEYIYRRYVGLTFPDPTGSPLHYTFHASG